MHDTPISNYWFDLYLAHPKGNVIFMHRPASTWTSKRLDFCHGGCANPYLEPAQRRLEDGVSDARAKLGCLQGKPPPCCPIPRRWLFWL